MIDMVNITVRLNF